MLSHYNALMQCIDWLYSAMKVRIKTGLIGIGMFGPDINQHQFQFCFFQFFSEFCYFLLFILSLLGLKAFKRCMYFIYWVIFLASGTSAALMTSRASVASVASMTLKASFHQKKTYWTWTLAPKWPILVSQNVGGIIKNPQFYWFLAPFSLEAVEAILWDQK